MKILFFAFSLFLFSCTTVEPDGSVQATSNQGDIVIPTNIPNQSSSSTDSSFAGFSKEWENFSPNSQLDFLYKLPDSIPDNTSQPGLLVYFHGDKATDYELLFPYLTLLGKQYGMVVLSILAPDSMFKFDNDIPNSPPELLRSWQANPDENFSDVWNLIYGEFVLGLPTDSRRTVLVGLSGGAYFVSEYLIGLYAYKLQGGAILLCGGGINKNGSNLPDSANLAAFPLFYHTENGDYAFQDAEESANAFLELGFPVYTEFTSGTEHCNFDPIKILESTLQDLLGGK